MNPIRTAAAAAVTALTATTFSVATAAAPTSAATCAPHVTVKVVDASATSTVKIRTKYLLDAPVGYYARARVTGIQGRAKVKARVTSCPHGAEGAPVVATARASRHGRLVQVVGSTEIVYGDLATADSRAEKLVHRAVKKMQRHGATRQGRRQAKQRAVTAATQAAIRAASR